MAVVYAFGGSGVTIAGPAVVLLLVRALSYSQQLQSELPLAGRGGALPRGARASARRTTVASVDPGGDRELDHIGRLTFDDVWFSYVPGVPVLQVDLLRRGAG